MNPALLALLAARAAAGSWTPASLSSLAAWWDASDTTTITESGGAVSEWADKSGNGYTLSQLTTTRQPTTGVGSQNGLNVLNFDGGDELTAANAADWAFLSDGTPILVGIAFAPTIAATMALLDTGGIARLDGMGLAWIGGTTRILNRVRAGGIITNNYTDTGTAPAGWNAVTLLGDYGAATPAARSAVWVGDSGPYENNTTAGAPSAFAEYPLHVGAEALFTTPLTGSIAEIVIARSPGTTERANLATYLKTKWGIA